MKYRLLNYESKNSRLLKLEAAPTLNLLKKKKRAEQKSIEKSTRLRKTKIGCQVEEVLDAEPSLKPCSEIKREPEEIMVLVKSENNNPHLENSQTESQVIDTLASSYY